MKLSDQDIERILLAVAAKAPTPEPDGWLERMEHRRLRVHTKSNQTYEGLLREAAPDGLVLWAVQLVEKTPVNLAGEVFVPQEQVLMVQTVRM